MAHIIAIDGPAGAGKGTIAKLIAKKLKFVYIDTGAMYRAVALKCIKEKITPDNEEGIELILKTIDIKFKFSDKLFDVYLDDENVSTEIRTMKVDEIVPKIAALKLVRDEILIIQKKITENTNIVIEGRDICTHVFPNANVKLFLDASLESRAKRRYNQNLEMGIDCTYQEIFDNIKERSLIDKNREHAPLFVAKDAEYIDTSELTIDQVLESVSNIISNIIKDATI